jgi:serine/threonine protein phosphatase PrpC/aminoglycoside phosphotransferase
MTPRLAVSIGQCSDPGRKPTNQDFHGAVVPDGSALALKGVALAIADGISSSPVSHVAAQIAVNGFLDDYYATSDTWSVERAAHRVISATNSWLNAESRRSRPGEDLDGGYVCTFSAVVLKARTAHVFHVGDGLVARVTREGLEPLSQAHRVVLSGHSYLGRALGMAPDVALDYRPAPLAEGDVLLLATDGLHEHLTSRAVAEIVAETDDLDEAARRLVQAALAAGSADNLTVQIVRIERLPNSTAADFLDQAYALPPPPLQQAPVEFDGYRLLEQIHANSRSHIYRARDLDTGALVAVKLPAMDLCDDPELLRRFAMEEWIADRVDSPHLLRAAPPARARRWMYVATEYLDGMSLRQWMHDNPAPDLEPVRRIVEQLVVGLRALHRNEIVHGDLRPENVMIDRDARVKIIDFGSAHVAGLAQATAVQTHERALGTVQYAAPELLLGDSPSWRSDLFALGSIAYEMLTGRLPYGVQGTRVRSVKQARALQYAPARNLPPWVDDALKTAVQPDPARRYEALSEFVADLRTPNAASMRTGFVPLAERNPLAFWQTTSLILGALCVGLLIRLAT